MFIKARYDDSCYEQCKKSFSLYNRYALGHYYWRDHVFAPCFLPGYLRHLPSSTSLITGPYGLVDERFWKTFHPLLILSLSLSLVLNWKLRQSRKLLLLAFGIYAVILVITFSFFVPELLAFAASSSSDLPAAEWAKRGARWEKLSWVRGAFMYAGFCLLLMAFAKSRVEALAPKAQKKRKLQAENV